MKRLVRSMKRSLSFLLTAAMIFTMMPQTGMTAEASEYQAESVLGGGKTVQETDLAAAVDSVIKEAETGETVVSYSETDPESGSHDDGGTNPGGETGSGTGEEPGSETNPGTGEEPDGETNPGAGDEAGGETNPGEEDGTGSETNPDTGDESGDETNPGTGDETDPGEGEETGGETNPGEDEETDGETDPGEEDETDEETDPDEEEENDKPDGKLSALENARSGVSDFTIDANGTLTAYNGAGGDVTIPDTVKAIGNDAFKNKTNITSVTIPGSVLSIGDRAFSGCSGMVKVTLNEGLQTIGNAAFEGAAFGKKELTAITNGTLTIPGSVTKIGGSAFQNSAYLETVVFESGQNDLVMSSDYNYSGSNGAFKNCKSLKEVTLPDNLKTLPPNTFDGCTALEKAVFGSGLETISGWVFSGCSSLQRAEMPDSLRTIGDGAFNGCSGMEEVTLNKGLETIGKAAFYGAAFGKKELEGITNGTLTIPGSVTSIGGAAFRNSAYLETVTFESGPTELVMNSDYNYNGNEGVFKNCKSLKEVTLPDNLKTLPPNTFDGCTALEKAVFGSGLETISGWAFSGCSSLQRAEMPDSLRTIRDGAFYGCSSMEEVILNKGLETIGKAAFYGAGFGKKELEGITNGTLTIPGSVTSIGGAAFRNSAYLEKVTFESGPTELVMNSDYNYNGSEGVFKSCKSLKEVTLPDNLKTLPKNTFEECSSLEQVQFGILLATIGSWAFNGCSSLQRAEMPDSLRTIEDGAFYGCSSMEEVILNKGLETIGKAAFYGAGFGKKELEGITNGTLTIPGSVTSIGGAAFRNSAYLEKVTFESGTTELVMNSDYNYNGNEGVFRNCKSLKEVTLPDNLKTLPKNTFEECSSLEQVQFGILLATIGSWAFNGCSSLQRAEMPDSLRTIEDGAFSGCSELEEVTLNEGLETIGRAAFYGAAFGKKELSGAVINGFLTIPGSVTSIGGAAFRNSAYLEKVTFESGTTELIMSSDYNYNGSEGAFKNCKSLKEVTLPDNLKALPKNTFEDCSALEEVEFGKYLESIGNRAFYNCSSLQLIYLSESLKTIEAEAFLSCGMLEALYIPKTVTTIGNNILSLKNSPKAVIYGIRGSEAETYANKNKIPFREKGELDSISAVTGISLNRSSITLVGASAIGYEISLKATVRPSTARNKRVNFTSSDERVASVSAQGKILIKDYGKAVITATTEDGGKTAKCTVNVLRQWTDEEKADIKEKLQTLNASKLTVVTNACPTVNDIELDLPSEYELQSVEWRVDGYPIADGTRPIYDVIVKKDQYQDAVIKGLTITGITVEDISVTGAGKLQNGGTTDLTAEITTVGGDLPEGSYDAVEWSFSNSAVQLDKQSGNMATVKGASSGTATVTAKLTVKNGDKKTAISSSPFKITVTNDRIASTIDITRVENGVTVPVDSSIELADMEDVKEYNLSATVRDGKNEVIENPSLLWKSSNTKVAEIKGQGSEAILKVKTETGAAVISVTANKNGGYTKTFRVVVKDSTPRLEETSINLNLNQNAPVATIRIVPSNGYEVAGEGLAVLLADGSGSGFTLEKTQGSVAEYQIGGSKDLRTGKYKVLVQVKTSNGKEHRLPLTISVVKQTPKVTLTQENIVNLYEEDPGETIISVSSEAKISKITYTPSAGSTSGKPKLVQSSDPQAGFLSLKTENLKKSNYKSTSLKGIIEITFEGYDKSVAYTNKSFTVKANKNVPAVQAVPASTVLYTGSEYEGTGLDTTAVTFNLKADGSELTKETGWSMKLQSGISGTEEIEASSDGQPLTVKILNSARNSVALKFTVSNEAWLDGVTATASCTVKKGKTPEMGFSNSKVILNTRDDAREADPLKIDLFVKNQPGRKISSVNSIIGKNTVSNEALDDKLDISFEEGRLEISIREQASINKTMKFSYTITGRDEKNVEVSGKLDVTVSTQAMKLTLKQSGSIDLLNREGTQITLKPTLNNYTDTIKSVDLYGSYADRFSAECENGSIVIKAEKDSLLKIKTTYNLSLRMVLESGVVWCSTVKVTPKQTNPKLTLNSSKTVLFESAPGDIYGKEIMVNLAEAGGPEIKSIELTNGGDTFKYSYEGDGAGILHVLPTASQKVNKTYKLKLAVRFRDGAVNAAPVYVTVSVNYKK